mgnify:CR=1 FL=1
MELSTLPGIKLIGAAILILYFLCLVILFLYSLTQFRLARSFVSKVKKPKQTPPELSHFPHVTVQLPLYNELYVVERLLKSIVAVVMIFEALFQTLQDQNRIFYRWLFDINLLETTA